MYWENKLFLLQLPFLFLKYFHYNSDFHVGNLKVPEYRLRNCLILQPRNIISFKNFVAFHYSLFASTTYIIYIIWMIPHVICVTSFYFTSLFLCIYIFASILWYVKIVHYLLCLFCFLFLWSSKWLYLGGDAPAVIH